MNRFKGTPAPWESLTETELELPSGIIKSGKKSIAHTLQKEVGAEQAKANANLIAAAPELLALLIKLDRIGGLGLSTHREIQSVIAKALGKII